MSQNLNEHRDHTKLNAPHSPLARRQFLRIGGLGCLGLTLPRLLEAEAARAEALAAGRSTSLRARAKSCILIFYYGGPCQLDTWDLKPTAPREVRGEFRPIAGRATGVQISEHLPRTAHMTDKLAIVRSLHHPMRNHNAAAVEALCGRTPIKGDLELLFDDPNSFPCYGSALSHVSPAAGGVPTHVALPHVMYNVVVLPGQNAGFLGAAHDPFQVTHDPNAPDFRVGELSLPAEMSPARLEHRRSLLSMLDAQSRPAQREAEEGHLSVYQERAFDLLRSEKVRQAFKLSQEKPALRDRYGRHRLGQGLLLARRLVDSGVRFVNVNDQINNGQLANWDSHENNFGRLKNDLLPPADQAFSALIEDLAERGLLESTLVVALGEFGRTPQINKNAGRDHWPDCFSTVLAGGGVRGSVVYGASDRIGAYPATDPVSSGDLAATLFWAFGLDPATELYDRTHRPFRLADGEPLRQLFSEGPAVVRNA